MVATEHSTRTSREIISNKDAQDVPSIEQPPGKRIRKTQPNAPPKNKKYTKAELKTLEQRRYERYQMLLDSARSNDMESTLVLPQHNKFEVGMVRKSITIHKRLEFIDIYDYLRSSTKGNSGQGLIRFLWQLRRL